MPANPPSTQGHDAPRAANLITAFCPLCGKRLTQHPTRPALFCSGYKNGEQRHHHTTWITEPATAPAK